MTRFGVVGTAAISELCFPSFVRHRVVGDGEQYRLGLFRRISKSVHTVAIERVRIIVALLYEVLSYSADDLKKNSRLCVAVVFGPTDAEHISSAPFFQAPRSRQHRRPAGFCCVFCSELAPSETELSCSPPHVTMVYSVTLMNPIAEADEDWPNDFLWEVLVGPLPRTGGSSSPPTVASGGSLAVTTNDTRSNSENGSVRGGGGGGEGSGQGGGAGTSSDTNAVRVTTEVGGDDLAISSSEEEEEEEEVEEGGGGGGEEEKEGGKNGSDGNVSDDGSDVAMMADDGDVEDVSADDDEGDSSDRNDVDELGDADKEEALLSGAEGENDAVDGASEAVVGKRSGTGASNAAGGMSVSGKHEDDADISSDNRQEADSSEDEVVVLYKRRTEKPAAIAVAATPATGSRAKAPSSTEAAGGQDPQPVTGCAALPSSPPPGSPSAPRPSPCHSLASFTSTGATSIDLDEDSGTDSSFDESEEDSDGSSDEDMEDDDGDGYEVSVPFYSCSVCVYALFSPAVFFFSRQRLNPGSSSIIPTGAKEVGLIGGVSSKPGL